MVFISSLKRGTKWQVIFVAIVAKRLQAQVAVLALAVRTKRINLSNIRQIYAILTTKPYLVGLDIFEKDKLWKLQVFKVA